MYRWLLIGGVLLGIAVAGLLSWTAPRTYTSSTQLFVNVNNTTDSSSAYDGNLFAQQRVASYAEILTGTQLAQKVVDELGLPLTAQQLASQVSVTPVTNTVVLDVAVTDTSPQRAQAIASSVGRQFTQQVTSLETPAGTAVSTVRVDTIQDATFDPIPVSPHVAGNLERGAAVGLVIALLVVVARIRLDRSVHDEDDVRTAAGLDVIARFPDRRTSFGARGRALAEDPSQAAAAARPLATYLHYADIEPRPQVLTIASAVPGEGKSTVAVALAVALVQSGSRVALVDANLARPRVSRYLGLPEGPGLVDVLHGSAELGEVTQEWDGTGLTVLPAGPLPPDPGELLSSGQMRAVLKVLRDTHDFVIIDAPPVLPVADAAAVSALADACLLVTRFGRTNREQVAEGAAAIQLLSGRVLGVVLTRVPKAAVPPAHRRPYEPDRQRGRTPSEPGRATTDGRPADTDQRAASPRTVDDPARTNTGAASSSATPGGRFGRSGSFDFRRSGA